MAVGRIVHSIGRGFNTFYRSEVWMRLPNKDPRKHDPKRRGFEGNDMKALLDKLTDRVTGVLFSVNPNYGLPEGSVVDSVVYRQHLHNPNHNAPSRAIDLDQYLELGRPRAIVAEEVLDREYSVNESSL